MADRNPLNDFEFSTNEAVNTDGEGQHGSPYTQFTSAAEQQYDNSQIVENRPVTVEQQQWHRRRDQQRRAQAEEARRMGGMHGGVVHQDDALRGRVPNDGFQFGLNQYHGQIANTPLSGDESSDRFGNARRSARAERTRNDMGYATSSPPVFSGPEQYAQGIPWNTERTQTPAPRNQQVAPVAPMFRREIVRPQNELVQVPQLQITDPRWIIDQERRATVQDPRWVAEWVHAEQTAIAQDDFRASTNRMLEEEIAANGGQVPAYLLPFLPPAIETEAPYIPMPTTFPSMTREQDLNTPEGVNHYLVEFSTRWPGHFEPNLEPGPDGIHLPRDEAGWSSYTPTASEVATWRALLIGGTQRADGRIWIRTTLAYILATALTRLEIHGAAVDPELGQYDIREAFEYALGRVLQTCPHDAEIQQLGQRVQGLLRNATPIGPPAFPALGLQLVNDHIRRVRGGPSSTPVPASPSSSAFGSGGSRPPGPPFSVAGYGAIGPAAAPRPSPSLGGRPASAMGHPPNFNGVATASMLPPRPSSQAGPRGPAAALDSGDFLGYRPFPSSTSTESTIPLGVMNSVGVQRPECRHSGRPRGSTAGGSTTTPTTPAGSTPLGRGQMPTGFDNNQAGVPSMLDSQGTSTGEAPRIAGSQLRRRRSQVNYDTSTAQQAADSDDYNDDEFEDRRRCKQCRLVGTHASNCPGLVGRCGECGFPAPNHRRDCPGR